MRDISIILLLANIFHYRGTLQVNSPYDIAMTDVWVQAFVRRLRIDLTPHSHSDLHGCNKMPSPSFGTAAPVLREHLRLRGRSDEIIFNTGRNRAVPC